MPRKKLTALGISSLKPPASGRIEHLDAVVPQLALRVTSRGVKSFTVRTRLAGSGRQVRITLGEWPSTSLEEARQKARDALNAAKRGISPTEVKRHERAAQRERVANDFASVADDFIKRYARRENRTWKESQRILNRYVTPGWSKRPIGDIKKSDVVSMLDDIEDNSGIYMANRTLAVVRKLFNWCMDERGVIETTPIGRNMARKGEKVRERHLDDGEIRAIWVAADGIPYPFGPFTKLLFATGQRRGEVASMRWEQIEDSVWLLPASATKSGRAHTVPLSELALDVIDGIPHIGDSGFMFTANNRTPISGFSAIKTKLDKLSKTSGWRYHDLRATMATRMEAQLNIPPHIVGALLNHDIKAYAGVTSIYMRGDPIEAKRSAMDAWGSLLARIIGDTTEDTVVELGARSV